MRLIKKGFAFIILLSIAVFNTSPAYGQSYKVVDTGQDIFYDNYDVINTPSETSGFYGQDAGFTGYAPSYTDNGDGTVTDNVTGLMWSKTPDLNSDGIIDYGDKITYAEALNGASEFGLAGYDDWRLPSIKELYSLIMFYGVDPSGFDDADPEDLTPFIDTEYFDFGYGDTGAGERIIDAQFATTSIYAAQGGISGEAQIMFGVNFADGRIKGYETEAMPNRTEAKHYYVLYVRGNTEYGVNDFTDNNDGTITDNATGLMWEQNDSGEGLTWEEALQRAKNKNEENYLGYNDWRLPNVKELQSIVDYTRAPEVTGSAAINELFGVTEITDEGGSADYPFYWSSTTHRNMVNGNNAAYVAFGKALGWILDPMNNYRLTDVHGAGAQRSDPKLGNPDDYPYGHGPQGDVIRIYNYVRLVRDADNTTSVGAAGEDNTPGEYSLGQNYPNPFNPSTTISFTALEGGDISLRVYDSLGGFVASLVSGYMNSGEHEVTWYAGNLASGRYFYTIRTGSFTETKQMLLVK